MTEESHDRCASPTLRARRSALLRWAHLGGFSASPLAVGQKKALRPVLVTIFLALISWGACATDAITGLGNLAYVGPAQECVTNSNVWITNLVVLPQQGNGITAVTFTLEGGSNGIPYDVFATSALGPGPSVWAWIGQGFSCGTYTITNNFGTSLFLILAGPQDSDNDSLTDAYERLISHTDPHSPNSNLDGLPDAWEALLDLDPGMQNIGNPAARSNYSYDSGDWLNGVSGVRTGSVSLDSEGNILSVSQ